MTSLISLIVAAVGFIADRATKNYAEEHFDGTPVSLFGGKVRLCKAVNTGFAMGKLENRRKLVTGVSIAVFFFAAAVYAVILVRSDYRPLRIAFGLVMAGAAGNVYDRWHNRYVVDFINIRPLKKIIFNLADVFVVTGSLITVLVYLCSDLK